MENVHRYIDSFISDVMDVESSSMEHLRLVWTGKFTVEDEKAISYIKEKTDSIDFMPMFRKDDEGEVKIILLPQKENEESKKWVNIVLLLVTILFTLGAGAFLKGANPLKLSNLVKGIPFSAAIMIILGSHELGHYFAAKKNNVDATFPYFIPAPHLVGTFGAVIKMKSPIPDKDSLIEIGAAGPIVGFILSTIALLIGLQLSSLVPIQEGGLLLGDSLLLKGLTNLFFSSIPEGKEVNLHPVAFAGWVGYFVTAMNLMPIGQLDGGHIAYALIERKQRFIAYIVFGGIIAASLLWLGWLIWGLVILFLIGFRHPPPLNNITEVSMRNRITGYICFFIFILTFVPNPIQVI